MLIYFQVMSCNTAVMDIFGQPNPTFRTSHAHTSTTPRFSQKKTAKKKTETMLLVKYHLPQHPPVSADFFLHISNHLKPPPRGRRRRVPSPPQVQNTSCLGRCSSTHLKYLLQTSKLHKICKYTSSKQKDVMV